MLFLKHTIPFVSANKFQKLYTYFFLSISHKIKVPFPIFPNDHRPDEV